MSDHNGDGQISDWSELYRATIVESDPDLVALLLPQAQHAIQERMHELWHVGPHKGAERERLNTAFHYLELLRTVVEKGPESDWKNQQ